MSLLLPLSSSTTTTNSVLKSPFNSIIKTTSSSRSNFHGFRRNDHHLLQLRSSSIIRVQPLKPCSSVNFSGGFSFRRRKLGFFPIGFENGDGDGDGETKKEVPKETSMPKVNETPNSPLIWPWLIALPLLVYVCRMVLWENSNWKKVAAGAVVPVVDVAEDVAVGILDVVMGAVADVIMGVVSVLRAIDTLPRALGVVLDIFCLTMIAFSIFIGILRGEIVSHCLHGVLLVGLGVILFAMGSYIVLAIYQHSKKLSEENEKHKVTTIVRRIPMPLLAVAFAIGIHVAMK